MQLNHAGGKRMKLMKAMMLGLALGGLAGPVLAMDKSELDNRISRLTAQFEALQQNPNTRIPAEMLRDAKGIVLLNLTKAGFVFAFQAGGGVAMVKDKSGDWGPVAFIRSNEGSFGFQAGGDQGFYVLLLMTTNATRQLVEDGSDFGAVARGTAGNNSAGVEGRFNSPANSVRVYAARSGFFGGVAFKGGNICADQKANQIYYGQFLTLHDILFGRKASPTAAAQKLAEEISAYSKK